MVCREVRAVLPVTTIIENIKRTLIKSLLARIRGFLGYSGEKRELVYRFPNRTRQ
jgi:hypothetical protein